LALLSDFIRVFELPPAMIPHVGLVAQEREMALVVGLANGALTLDQAAELLRMPLAEAEAFLMQAYYRRLIQRETADGGVVYRAATFYRRLDAIAMYEAWGAVPADARDAVIEWQLQEFIQLWQPVAEQMRRDPDAYTDIPNRDVLLLDEALEMVDAATEHVIMPCDCRAIVMACDRPRETCVRLDEGARLTLERGHGRRVTKAEMKQTVGAADRDGLMHTGLRAWRTQGELFGLCNCCACDCYPIRAGVRLGMVRQWPRAHYVAERNLEKCCMCGKCVQRCHFGAFYHDGARMLARGKRAKHVVFDAGKCWGCGLCATACPEQAIAMRPLRATAATSTTAVLAHTVA
jgi:Pyruvate/2-oxoacid:ferredoxin oxidoreductase delta subunit